MTIRQGFNRIPGQDNYKFSSICPFCNKQSTVTVPGFELFTYNQTGRIDAFKSLTLGERETILTGSHESCFDAAFAEEEEASPTCLYCGRPGTYETPNRPDDPNSELVYLCDEDYAQLDDWEQGMWWKVGEYLE